MYGDWRILRICCWPTFWICKYAASVERLGLFMLIANVKSMKNMIDSFPVVW